ncbi:MAG TPA: hypothetical protein VI423_00480 [Paenisporosarcina sp.]|nr:hypothetical protein [Paenisporosarcina sp.]
MEKKQAKPVSRSVYQKLAEENKKLKADLKILCFDKPSVDSITVRAKWKIHFLKEANFNSLMKDFATNYIKEHPEYDITKK